MLNKLTILITRPKHQAETLNNALLSYGFSTVLLPTIEIVESNQKPSPKKIISQLSQCNIMIFLSANAVTHALENLEFSFQHHTVIGIGLGTEKKLKEYHINCLLPDEFNSEGLLNMEILKSSKNKKITIFSGESSRPLLKETLKKLGADVKEIIVYKRTMPHIDSQKTYLNLKNQSINLIISTSAESLENLHTVFKNYSAWLTNIPLLVISEKMKLQAKALGWKKIVVSKSAVDDDVVFAVRNSLSEH